MQNTQLIIIDPQHDFCNANGSLFVPGAHDDMQRVAAFIERMQNKLTDIHVTLDSHQVVDISHPLWFMDAAGNPPSPFTIIKEKDMIDRVWMTKKPGLYAATVRYLNALESSGRYPHCIWPEHCRIGTEGATVHPDVNGALQGWMHDKFATVDYVTKGSNPYTEHFSAVQAEVPDPSDPSTQMNTKLVDTLEDADTVILTGEALSHCLANTGRDIVKFASAEFVKKLVLLTDASSNVPTCDSMGDSFVSDMVALGMRTSTTVDFLKVA